MSDPQATDPAAGATWSEQGYRNLKIAVVVMGILLVAGFILVFITILSRLSGSAAPTDAAPVATVAPEEVARLLDADGEVVSTAIDGNRLALVLRRAEGHAVVVIDLRSGQIINVVTGR